MTADDFEQMIRRIMRAPRDAQIIEKELLASLITECEHSVEWQLPVQLRWNWSKGHPGSLDTPVDPPGPEDIVVMLHEQDITDKLSFEQLQDVRAAILRDME